jgi:hypothetical protein
MIAGVDLNKDGDLLDRIPPLRPTTPAHRLSLTSSRFATPDRNGVLSLHHDRTKHRQTGDMATTWTWRAIRSGRSLGAAAPGARCAGNLFAAA